MSKTHNQKSRESLQTHHHNHNRNKDAKNRKSEIVKVENLDFTKEATKFVNKKRKLARLKSHHIEPDFVESEVIKDNHTQTNRSSHKLQKVGSHYIVPYVDQEDLELTGTLK